MRMLGAGTAAWNRRSNGKPADAPKHADQKSADNVSA
jgi:hypothetical protein